MSVSNELEKTKKYLRNTRKAILGRGGEVSATAGLKDLPNAIFNIPADASLAYYTDDTTAYRKIVPSAVEEYAPIQSVGGMTRKVVSPNLYEYARADGEQISGTYKLMSIPLSTITSLTNKFKFDLINNANGYYPTITYGEAEETIASCSLGDVIDFSGRMLSSCWLNIDFSAYSLPFAGVTVYPILYEIPDDDPDFTITEYIPYGAEKLVSTPVTEILSKDINGEVIDIVAIPDAVKSLDGWGHGLRSAMANLTTQRDFHNTYDFTTKEYTKWLSEKIVIDGVNIKAVNMTSTIGGFQVDLKRTKSTYADYTALKMTNFTPALTKAAYTGYLVSNGTSLLLNLFTGNGDITTIDGANAWLQENPIEVVYAFDKPIVTQIDDAATQFIKVEGGGELVFENTDKADVPSSIRYVRKV